KEVKEINLFVDFAPRGRFHKFVNAAITALSTTSFQPGKLVGMTGEAVLSHYTPKGGDYAYAQMNGWVFYKSHKEVTEALAKYQEDDDFDIEEVGEDNV